MGESDCAHIFWPESQTRNKAIRTMVTQRLISLLTWQEEKEGKGEREGRGVQEWVEILPLHVKSLWCSQQFVFFPSGSNHPLYFLKDSLPTVHFSHSAVSNCLWPHGLQHARPPCPSPTPIVYSNSCPLSSCCHPTISFSVVPFSSHLQSFPASGSFQRRQFFASGGQSIGVSASVSVLPINISGLISFRMDWFALGLSLIFVT